MSGVRGTSDGRVLRGRRNREAVVEAFLSLIEDGDPRPTAKAIAARAGLSTRSVFQHFDDLEQIYEVAGRRRRLLERLDPVARAARLREPFSTQLQANRDAVVKLMRIQCRDSFEPELSGLEPGARERTVTAIATASSWAAWYHLRNDQHLDEWSAAKVVRMLLLGLLEAADLPVSQSPAGH